MINHGDYSIIGLNNDASQEEEYNTDVINNNSENLKRAIQRLFYTSDIKKIISCCKIDFVKNLSEERSLEIAVDEIFDNHFCIFPGKMTEAPYLTDYLVQIINCKLDNIIQQRPVDLI